MRSRTFAALLALTLAAGTGSALAQGAAGAGEPRRPRPPVDLALDVDANEIIDATEIANAATALARLDRDADGRLAGDELRPPRPQGGQTAAPDAPPPASPPRGAATPPAGGARQGGPEGRRPRPPIVAALDLDGDGAISAGELAGAVAALKKLDADGDGRLTPEEYRPPHPRGPAAPVGR